MNRLIGIACTSVMAMIILAALFAPDVQACTAKEQFDHSPLDRVLKRYVDERGYVDYSGLKTNRADLDSYVEALGRTSPANAPDLFPDRASQLAYWINAYNAFVLQGVINRYPKHDLTGLLSRYKFFLRTKHLVGGRKMSLDEIENKILREQLREPRIHFAIVCASEGCPRLARDAYLPEKLEEQLDTQARRFINEERSVKIDNGRGRLLLSKIFDWFKKDFTDPLPAGQKNITVYLKRYLTAERLQALEQLRSPRIEYIEYDWRINDQARGDVAATR
jgi:hypothetical protein